MSATTTASLLRAACRQSYPVASRLPSLNKDFASESQERTKPRHCLVAWPDRPSPTWLTHLAQTFFFFLYSLILSFLAFCKGKKNIFRPSPGDPKKEFTDCCARGKLIHIFQSFMPLLFIERHNFTLFFVFLIGARTEQSMLELILNQMGEWNFFCFEFYLLMFNLNLPLSFIKNKYTF